MTYLLVIIFAIIAYEDFSGLYCLNITDEKIF